MKNILFEIVGWTGTAIIVGDFFLMSHHYIDTGNTYQIANIAGSALLGVQLYTKKAWPPLGLQIVWVGIALSALWSMA